MQKTILITGSTDGIGKLAAIKFAKAGHHVFIHGRNETKLKSLISELKESTNNPNINGFIADFSDLDAIKKLGEQIKTDLAKIDVLINNAGVFKSKMTHNKNGWDFRYVVNYIAPYIFTNLLLPVLKKSESPRIINLSSAAQDVVNYDAFIGKTNLSERATYGQSKLALTMWTNYLAKEEKDILVIPVNPGSLLNTNMVKEAFGQFWSSADKGADILYDLSISDGYTNDSGKYFDNDQGDFSTAHPDAYNDLKINQLIAFTKNLLK